MRKKIRLALFGLVFALLFFALMASTLKQWPKPRYESTPVQTLGGVALQVNGKTTDVKLPYGADFSARTAVSWSTPFSYKPGDSLYIKTVYAPIKVYVEDVLVYEYGAPGSYAAFLRDPPTQVALVPLEGQGAATLRVEYLSPVSRSTLMMHPVLVGKESDIISALFQKMGLSFCLSLLQILLGGLLFYVALIIMSFERKGVLFLWLAVFSLSAGVWAFGENNFTVLMLGNPSILYVLAFVGMFCMPIPLFFYGLSAVEFHLAKWLRWLGLAYTGLVSAALFLQLTSAVALSQSMYLFHILVPGSMFLLAGMILYEGLRYKNKAARSLFSPIIVLAVFALLEVVNYQVRFTDVISFFFQIGVMVFILLTTAKGAVFVVEVIRLYRTKQRMEFEQDILTLRVDAQRRHHHQLLQNETAIRAQRHDLRHQLTVLRSYSESGKTEELQRYIDTLIQAIPREQNISYCENSAVNAIVGHYVERAQSAGVTVEIAVEVPARPQRVNDTHLCVVFGNLLENAVEACERMQEGTRFLTLRSCVQNKMLVITMDNSFDGRLLQFKNQFFSQKRNEMGMGLVSVASVAKKCGGNARFEGEEKVFHSSVYLCL